MAFKWSCGKVVWKACKIIIRSMAYHFEFQEKILTIMIILHYRYNTGDNIKQNCKIYKSNMLVVNDNKKHKNAGACHKISITAILMVSWWNDVLVYEICTHMHKHMNFLLHLVITLKHHGPWSNQYGYWIINLCHLMDLVNVQCDKHSLYLGGHKDHALGLFHTSMILNN